MRNPFRAVVYSFPYEGDEDEDMRGCRSVDTIVEARTARLAYKIASGIARQAARIEGRTFVVGPVAVT